MKKHLQARRFLKHRPAKSYRPGWRFPAIIEYEIRKWIIPPSLNVCSGHSSMGDVKLDLYERADIKGAMRYLPVRPDYFNTLIFDPPYAMHRLQTMGLLIELRSVLKPGGRLITVHYMDPGCFLQRSMKLLYKAYYEPKTMSGVRVVTVLEKLSGFRIKPGRRDCLISVSPTIWEPEPFQELSCVDKSSLLRPHMATGTTPDITLKILGCPNGNTSISTGVSGE